MPRDPSDGPEDEELERIRERRRRELVDETTSTAAPSDPVDLDGPVREFVQDHEFALIDLWAPWCGPCKVVGPIVEELARDVDELAVGKVNVDDHPDVARRHGAEGVPTLLVFRGGELVDRHVGAAEKPALRQLVDEHRP